MSRVTDLQRVLSGLLGLVALFGGAPADSQQVITFGAIMNLSERDRSVSDALVRGIETAFREMSTPEITLTLAVQDDQYNPQLTPKAFEELVSMGVVGFVGSTGTPTLMAILRELAQAQLPAIALYTGADALNDPQILAEAHPLFFNVRARYSTEVAALVTRFIDVDRIAPERICVFGQNDGFGLLGLRYLREQLAPYADRPAVATHREALQAVIDVPPTVRNGLGPAGFYERALTGLRAGVESLRSWGDLSGHPCEAVLVFATQEPTLDFLIYTQQVGFTPSVGLLSVVDRSLIATILSNQPPRTAAIYYSQLVPPGDSDLPLMAQARAHLGDIATENTNILEGYLAGRLAAFASHEAAKEGQVTPARLRTVLRRAPLDLAGLTLDFTQSNQGAARIWLFRYAAPEFRLLDSR